MATPPVNWGALVKLFARQATSYWSSELVRTIGRPEKPPPTPRDPAPVVHIQELNVPSPMPLVVPSPPALEGERPQGCTTCQIHKAVMSARGHVESIVVYAERVGSIDPSLPSTLLLADQELEQAMGMVNMYEIITPAQAEQCATTRNAISAAKDALPTRASCSLETCRAAMPALTDAMASATDLAVAHETLVKRVRGMDRLRSIASLHGVTDVDGFFKAFEEELKRG